MTDVDDRTPAPRPTEMQVRARADALLSRMTVEEKVGQLVQYFSFGPHFTSDGPALQQPDEVEHALARGRTGALLFVTDPAETNRLQRLAIEGSRHGIPALFGFDVVHGLRTIFPVPIAMAASWDPGTVERGQAVAAREARAVGVHLTFAPMLDIARDPRWGRMVEGPGEDPYLASALAAAQVRGFQGDDVGAPDRIIAGPKHFVGYGAALGGRDYDEVDLSESALRNVYLPPFRAAVEAGAGNVMSAYMDLNGIPAGATRRLFTEILREQWGFTGFVVTDADAGRDLVTHGFAADAAEAAARGVGAGVDLEMATTDPAYAHLPEALERGDLDIATVDASVRRILEAKVRLGLFERPFVDERRAAVVLADPAHREEARVAAERSAVLLRNEGGLLPLDPTTLRSVAVLGPLADSRRDTLGPWVFDVDLDETVTVLAGLRGRLDPAVTEVRFAPGIRPARRVFPSMFDVHPGNVPADPEDFDDDAELRRAVSLAAGSDVAVVVLGEWQHMIGEGASRSSLDLPGRQEELLRAVVATGTPVVLVLMNGRPLDLRWAAENVPAILDVWYPGTRGGTAAARLLTGDVSPAGRLPFTWPRSVGQVPLIYSHTRSHSPSAQGVRYWDEASTPLFPFGFGLSYGRFAYSGLTLDRISVRRGESVAVSVTVTNTGNRDADEVAQLYLHQRHGTASRPVRELAGFRRLHVPAGGSRDVVFRLGPAELSYWNAAAGTVVQDRAPFDVWVGGDATAELTTSFVVTG
ncbi:glycoside hydrolase family 3 N-terminal domain-containing protein [Pseudonocardia alni]|uniref:glycoside hydrolase family 3 N-terminal domain-containing protein n=1 Tax=Pseudonocardia alni TaxID=33907 RepID=UPI0033EF5101